MCYKFLTFYGIKPDGEVVSLVVTQVRVLEGLKDIRVLDHLFLQTENNLFFVLESHRYLLRSSFVYDRLPVPHRKDSNTSLMSVGSVSLMLVPSLLTL